MSKTSDTLRINFKAGDDIRDAGLTTPEDIVRQNDIVYGMDSEWQVLDVYRPKTAGDSVLPVIVSFHGGGWVYGDKERYQYYCMSLAQHGFAVVNYTYRLAPEYKFPASLEDANLVFEWIGAHAEIYGLDRENIFAVGDSAGGQQLGIYTAILTDPEYAKRFPFHAPKWLQLRGIALNCGVYRVDQNLDKTNLSYLLMEDYLPDKGSDKEIDTVCVLNHVNAQFPPVFLMSATGDFKLPDIPPMEAKLTEKKVPFEYHFYGDSEHELGHVFHCNMKLKAAHRCNKDECSFFKKLVR